MEQVDLPVFLLRDFLGPLVVILSGHCGDWISLTQPLLVSFTTVFGL